MTDTLLRALAMGGRARVCAAITTGAVDELHRIHQPSPTVTAALGRVATGALLLAGFLEKVTAREPMLTLERLFQELESSTAADRGSKS